MRICVLASGSSGNCTFVSAGDVRILIDAGVSYARIKSALKTAVDVDIEDIDAILFTHEHVDHYQALKVLHAHHPKIPLFANEGTSAAIEQRTRLSLPWQIFENGSPFSLGILSITAFSVSHDCDDPVGFVISSPRARLGIATDLGLSTHLVRHRLSDCDALILECNYDLKMLRDSGRPQRLIQRVAGSLGHLSNEQSTELLSELLSERLRAVFPAHISAECNDAELVGAIYSEILSPRKIRTVMTYRDRPSEVVRV